MQETTTEPGTGPSRQFKGVIANIVPLFTSNVLVLSILLNLERAKSTGSIPIMAEVVRGIEEGDVACVALGVDLVEEDALFPFGSKLKSNTARALRRSQLNEAQKSRLRERVSTMLASGIVPHEMREYAKLLRTIGVGGHWSRLERDIPRDNPYAMRFYKSLRAAEGLPV